MPTGPFSPGKFPPIDGLPPITQDDAEAFEQETHSSLVESGLSTIIAVAQAAQAGRMPLTRALGLIQGTAEQYRNLANLYAAGEPEFEKDGYGGGLVRRRRPENAGGLAGIPHELTGMLEGQAEAVNISALTSILKSDASEDAKAVASARLDALLLPVPATWTPAPSEALLTPLPPEQPEDA